jgi:hypothetical protein
VRRVVCRAALGPGRGAVGEADDLEAVALLDPVHGAWEPVVGDVDRAGVGQLDGDRAAAGTPGVDHVAGLQPADVGVEAEVVDLPPAVVQALSGQHLLVQLLQLLVAADGLRGCLVVDEADRVGGRPGAAAALPGVRGGDGRADVGAGLLAALVAARHVRGLGVDGVVQIGQLVPYPGGGTAALAGGAGRVGVDGVDGVGQPRRCRGLPGVGQLAAGVGGAGLGDGRGGAVLVADGGDRGLLPRGLGAVAESDGEMVLAQLAAGGGGDDGADGARQVVAQLRAGLNPLALGVAWLVRVEAATLHLGRESHSILHQAGSIRPQAGSRFPLGSRR